MGTVKHEPQHLVFYVNFRLPTPTVIKFAVENAQEPLQQRRNFFYASRFTDERSQSGKQIALQKLRVQHLSNKEQKRCKTCGNMWKFRKLKTKHGSIPTIMLAEPPEVPGDSSISGKEEP
jgi:hypothetical protein